MVILTICPIDNDKRYRRSYRITQHFGEHFPLKHHGWTELGLADESGVEFDEEGAKKVSKGFRPLDYPFDLSQGIYTPM
jgi:hypothetical protein